MDQIDVLFPRYDQAGRELVRAAYLIAEEALKDHTRSNGQPFIGHPLAVARIACDEIGLSAECVAAVFLHEATRFFPDTDIASAKFGKDVYTIVDGLNKSQQSSRKTRVWKRRTTSGSSCHIPRTRASRC